MSEDRVFWVENESHLSDLFETIDVVVVDFTAPAWCGPCQKFAPHFEAAADSAAYQSNILGRTLFVAVDVDKAPWATVTYGVRGVPRVTLFSKFLDESVDLKSRTAPPLLKEIAAVFDN